MSPEPSFGATIVVPHSDTERLDGSIVIPVNVKGDLEEIQQLLGDLARYDGDCQFETVLVVNNYERTDPPLAAIDAYRATGARVISVPHVPRRPGVAVPFSVRIHGARLAGSDWVISFDADCRIPNARALLDWYVAQGRDGCGVAYTGVDYHDVPPGFTSAVRVRIHHFARWVKRAVLRIPTTRGSNYAARKDVLVGLYDRGYLADELNVGPTARARGERVTYSGAAELRVTTSGRMFSGGWRELLRYFWYRLRYNVRVLPVRSDAARRTGRSREPADRYDYTGRPRP